MEVEEARASELLRETRKFLGLSQKRLADRLGVTDRTIRRWESGRMRVPALAIIALRAVLAEGRRE